MAQGGNTFSLALDILRTSPVPRLLGLSYCSSTGVIYCTDRANALGIILGDFG